MLVMFLLFVVSQVSAALNQNRDDNDQIKAREVQAGVDHFENMLVNDGIIGPRDDQGQTVTVTDINHCQFTIAPSAASELHNTATVMLPPSTIHNIEATLSPDPNNAGSSTKVEPSVPSGDTGTVNNTVQSTPASIDSKPQTATGNGNGQTDDST